MKFPFRIPPLPVAALLVCLWFSACSPARHFDYTTHRAFDASSLGGTAAEASEPEATAEVTAPARDVPAGADNERRQAAAALAAGWSAQTDPLSPAAVVPKLTKKETGKLVREVRQQVKAQRKLLKKGMRAVKATKADHPLNDGITAALILLGLGVVVVLLASLLPSLISVIGWILGVAVLVIGVTFLVLALLGFEVHLIG